MKFVQTYLLVLILSLSYSTVYAQLALDHYALTPVHVIDVVEQKVLYDQTIVIKDGKIVEVNQANKIQLPDSVQQLRMDGKYVIPGLIDAHVHLATDPSKEKRSNAEIVLKEMLLSGVTSVRDMAGDARALSSLSRDALVGDIESPNIYYSALMAGPVFFDDPRTIATAQGGHSGHMPYMRAVTDTTDLQLAVAEAKGTGAHGIKLYAHLSAGLMKKIVDEATRQNIKVWAHAALPPTVPSEITETGIISFSHASMLAFEKYPSADLLPKSWEQHGMTTDNHDFWDAEYKKLNLAPLYEKIKRKGIVLDATLSVYNQFYKDHPKHRWKYEMTKRITAEAQRAGVKICAGSDTDQETFVQEEMKLLVNECGFSPMEAIVSASLYSAESLGRSAQMGSIDPGKQADLVVLNQNPVDNLEHLNEVLLVIKSGRIFNGGKTKK